MVKQGYSSTNQGDLPDDVLDQAFYWAMLLGDTQVAEDDLNAHQHWLAQSPLHQQAWQRMQMVEGELCKIENNARSKSARALNQVVHNRSRRQRKLAATALSFMLMCGIGLNASYDQLRYDYATRTGEQETLTLEGGAIVHLDSHTLLDLNRVEGRLVLSLYQGQILIDSSAAKVQNKPQVRTSEARFTPVGTRFVVRKPEHASELTVTEGQVQIKTAQQSQLATAGEQFFVTEGLINSNHSNGLSADAWADGLIEADDAPLGEVISALDKHHKGYLRVSPTAAQIRVTGVFRLDDIDGALATLQRSLPINIKRTTDWWIRIDTK